jgi:hypothetical protein
MSYFYTKELQLNRICPSYGSLSHFPLIHLSFRSKPAVSARPNYIKMTFVNIKNREMAKIMR